MQAGNGVIDTAPATAASSQGALYNNKGHRMPSFTRLVVRPGL